MKINKYKAIFFPLGSELGILRVYRGMFLLIISSSVLFSVFILYIHYFNVKKKN